MFTGFRNSAATRACSAGMPREARQIGHAMNQPQTISSPATA